MNRSWLTASSMAIILASGSLTACSTYAVSRYSASVENVSALRPMKGQPINVGKFTAKDEEHAASIMCRGVGPIKTPDDETFAQYVRKAFISELTLAEAYSAAAPVTLTGTLDNVGFSSTSGEWEIDLTVASSNGKSLHIEEKYGFTSSFLGDTACNQTAQAFVPAVQDLITKLVRHPGFEALVGSPDRAAVAAGP